MEKIETEVVFFNGDESTDTRKKRKYNYDEKIETAIDNIEQAIDAITYRSNLIDSYTNLPINNNLIIKLKNIYYDLCDLKEEDIYVPKK